MNAREEYRYNRLTWPEMNEAIAMQKVVILPTGSTEQHGRHLPLDTDVLLCESVCLEVGKRAADRVLVLPPISYGLNMHHIDFPGTIHIEPEVFISFCLNITKSVAYHGVREDPHRLLGTLDRSGRAWRSALRHSRKRGDRFRGGRGGTDRSG